MPRLQMAYAAGRADADPRRPDRRHSSVKSRRTRRASFQRTKQQLNEIAHKFGTEFR